MNILLDYLFRITAILGTAQASTAFLKQVLVVVKPKSGATEDTITLTTNMSGAQALTDSAAALAEIQELYNAGMTRVYIVAVDDLDLASILAGADGQKFFTILISSQFSDAEIDQAQADGTITVTAYANLVSGTDDVVTIEGTAFTAQAAAVTEGDATFQAATSNEATAASLAAQINAHPVVSELVEATVDGAVVTVTAVSPGVAGNDIGLSYTDNDTNVGITLAGLSGGNLSGGAGLLVGTFKGVVGIYSNDKTKCSDRAADENRCGFYSTSSVKAKNMFYAFGKMLSNSLNWKNQQYISMPYADDVDELGEADALFDDRVSFVLDDAQYGKRLAFFAQGGLPIVAPYIARNLQIDLQSKALSYISTNQPEYTPTHASLLEDELKKVIDNSGDPLRPGYIQKGWILDGDIEIKLEQDDFVASGYIEMQKAGALWKVNSQMIQS